MARTLVHLLLAFLIAARAGVVDSQVASEARQVDAATPAFRAGIEELMLRRLARQTDGRAFFTDEAKDLGRFYGQIREELANQYSLAYEPTASADGRFRRLEVRVARPNTTARTRAGYFSSHPVAARRRKDLTAT